MLFKAFCYEHPKIVTDSLKSKVYNIAKEVVRLEDKFIELAYEMGAPEGLSISDIKLYIRYMADMRLIMLGMKPIYGVKDNPLPWLSWLINGVDISNFFEKRVTQYCSSASTGSWNDVYDKMEDCESCS
jgi:ribonucleoside-diphosphate reductase beta chain